MYSFMHVLKPGENPYAHLSEDKVESYVNRGGKLVQPEHCPDEM